MNYLYHMVPENLKGGELMPLNSLKRKYPTIYKNEMKKYEGRRSVLKIRIPELNCLWNDVLHFTAIHPSKVSGELKKLRSPIKVRKWFLINPNNLDKDKIIVWNGKFIPFNLKNMKNYSKIPRKTLIYYKKEITKGKRPLIFAYTPHILYKGELKIKDLEVIKA